MTAKIEKKDSPDITTSEAVPGWIQSTVERLARTSFGQAVLRHLDRFLWVVEKSAEWSLPQDETYPTEGEIDESPAKVELIRPLPWILFLPSLVILRSIRAGLNIGAFILGSPRIEPITVVRFVQKNRKSLKGLRSPNESSRTKFKHKAQDKRLSMNEAKKALIRSIRLTLSTLSCLDGSKPSLSPPPTRIRVTALDLDVATTPEEERSPTESAESPERAAKRKNSAEAISSVTSDDSADETLQQKINRLASESSTEDSDFIPAASSTFSSDDNDHYNEDDLSISQDELQDIIEDSKMHDAETCVASDAETEQKQNPREQKTSGNKDCDKTECDLSAQSTDSKEFQTPNRLSPDSEAPFYSPPPSGTATPERSESPTVVKNPTDPLKKNEFGNGEVHFVSESTTSERLPEEVNNGACMEKRSTNTNKYHQRGKRTSHGNRKKK